MTRFTTEFSARVYNDDTGTYVQIGPDRDGLGLCRLVHGEAGVEEIEIHMSWDQATAVANAILDIAPKNIVKD